MKYLPILLLLFSCQSETDSALEAWAQTNLKNPDSYEAVSSGEPDGGWVWHEYRATNGFGAITTEGMYFLIDNGRVTSTMTFDEKAAADLMDRFTAPLIAERDSLLILKDLAFEAVKDCKINGTGDCTALGVEHDRLAILYGTVVQDLKAYK